METESTTRRSIGKILRDLTRQGDYYRCTIRDVAAPAVADVTARVNRAARAAGLDPETAYLPWPGRGPNPTAHHQPDVLSVTAWGTTAQLAAFAVALAAEGLPPRPGPGEIDEVTVGD